MSTYITTDNELVVLTDISNLNKKEITPLPFQAMMVSNRFILADDGQIYFYRKNERYSYLHGELMCISSISSCYNDVIRLHDAQIVAITSTLANTSVLVVHYENSICQVVYVTAEGSAYSSSIIHDVNTMHPILCSITYCGLDVMIKIRLYGLDSQGKHKNWNVNFTKDSKPRFVNVTSFAQEPKDVCFTNYFVDDYQLSAIDTEGNLWSSSVYSDLKSYGKPPGQVQQLVAFYMSSDNNEHVQSFLMLIDGEVILMTIKYTKPSTLLATAPLEECDRYYETLSLPSEHAITTINRLNRVLLMFRNVNDEIMIYNIEKCVYVAYELPKASMNSQEPQTKTNRFMKTKSAASAL